LLYVYISIYLNSLLKAERENNFNINYSNNQFAKNFEDTRNELDNLKNTFEDQFSQLKSKCKKYKELYKNSNTENITFLNRIKEFEEIVANVH